MNFLRDTPIGQLLRFTSLKQHLLYPEEQQGFQPPEATLHKVDIEKQAAATRETPLAGAEASEATSNGISVPHEISESSLDVTKLKKNEGEPDTLLVDWYDANDPANPKNWSGRKKAWVTTVICVYTFVIYGASSIIVPANGYIIERFGISEEKALLTLSIGVGPMLFSPLSEIASVGRNLPYLFSFLIYFVISIILAAVADRSFAGLIVLRVLQAFFGSPILASGGASIDDIFDREVVPYLYVPWVAAMYCAPAVGPTLSAYAVTDDWRWPLWEIVFMSIFVLVMLPLLPETSTPNILYKRAVRLRATTGKNYRSKAELVKLEPAAIALEAVTIPVIIPLKDPAIGFVAIYSAVLYGTYYSFFEAFPIVYPGEYDFGLGPTSLVFLVIVIGCTISVAGYVAYLYFHFIPLIRRERVEPEEYLRVSFRKLNKDHESASSRALARQLFPYQNYVFRACKLTYRLASVYLLPIGLFLFAWTARESIHWIVPTLGIGIFSCTSFVFFQSIICYIGLAYPDYVASLFAGNDFVRCMAATGFIMFSTPMYKNLGHARGVSLLGGLSVTGVLGLHYLYSYGAWMRSKSRFAVG